MDEISNELIIRKKKKLKIEKVSNWTNKIRKIQLNIFDLALLGGGFFFFFGLLGSFGLINLTFFLSIPTNWGYEF